MKDDGKTAQAQKEQPAQHDGLDLRKHKFPSVTMLDVAFSTFRTDPALLVEAKRRGFYNGSTPYNRLVSKLFFSGGKVVFKPDVPEDFKNAAWPYVRAFMGSFEPAHEEKEAICAMLLSELTEPTLAPATSPESSGTLPDRVESKST